MDKSGPVYTKAKITVKYVMGCAIGMQLHSHGLVKNLRHGLHNRDVTTIPLSS